MSQRCALILADSPQALGELLFWPMVRWEVTACRAAGIQLIGTAGYPLEQIEEDVTAVWTEASVSLASQITAIRMFLKTAQSSDVLLLSGDTPLLCPETIEAAYTQHRQEENAITMVAAEQAFLTGHSFKGEESACWCHAGVLLEMLSCPDQMERMVSVARILNGIPWKKLKSGVYHSSNPGDTLRANSSLNRLQLNQLANRREAERLMEDGVEFLSLDGILIGADVQVGKGTRILPGTILRDGAQIGENCVIGPNSYVSASTIGNGTCFNSSQCYSVSIGNGVTIGPFCHLRPNTVLKDGVHVGDFVEIKNSVIGESTHIAHLTYVGDSDVGRKVNFGCGVAVANYNGTSKNRCVVGDNAFIGCNTNLVAPVTIGTNGYTAAGSTITDNVPDDALAIARARQVTKEGYNKKLRG